MAITWIVGRAYHKFLRDEKKLLLEIDNKQKLKKKGRKIKKRRKRRGGKKVKRIRNQNKTRERN